MPDVPESRAAWTGAKKMHNNEFIDGTGMTNGGSHKNGKSRKKTHNIEILTDLTDEFRRVEDDVEAYPQTEVLTNSPEQQATVEKAIYDLLDAFHVNWDDPNYTRTPERVAKAYLEYWVSGYAKDPRDEITVFPNTGGKDDIVMVKDMKFFSLCSHHLAPIEGYAAIAYIPGKNLLGLSKLGRILEIYARRFQLQERIGQQTADALMDLLEPQGVMVILYNVTHGCMSSRGVKLHESNTTTVTTRGAFKHDAELRNQVMSMLTLRNP